ncbi:cupin-like domain-containing protein [Azospirillum endophyticum]|uniref:cupin-like domain-containing protein n=1 Tax=Azospirillum endophyticum TaxID=2800326 RepID=UPI001903A077|nr:cupin-like domain-containing protein [Azospirillum endophyticum]
MTDDDVDELLSGGIGGRGTPFIVTDAMADWSCMQWSFDWFKKTYGETIVITSASFESDIRMRGRLSDYIDYITEDGDLRGRVPKNFSYVGTECQPDNDGAGDAPAGPQYLVSWDLENISSIGDHFHQPYFMQDRNLLDRLMPETRRAFFNKHTFAFIGAKGSLSQLHNDHDHTHSYLAQILGRKKLVLFSPAEAELVAEMDPFGFTVGGTGLDPRNPDKDKFPRFMETTPFECVIEPGDLLFLPSGWLHCAYGLTAGISVARDSVDRWNFGRWFQSMAITNLPKLASRVVQHPSLQGEGIAPPWLDRVRSDPYLLSLLSTCYRP